MHFELEAKTKNTLAQSLSCKISTYDNLNHRFQKMNLFLIRPTLDLEPDPLTKFDLETKTKTRPAQKWSPTVICVLSSENRPFLDNAAR